MSYPQLDPVYNFNNQPSPVVFYPGNQISAPLFYPSYPAASQSEFIFPSKRPRIIGLIMLVLMIPQILCLIFSLYFSSWFEYCYWEFSLSWVKKLPHKTIPIGASSHGLNSFYNILCEPDNNYYPMCPGLCTSLKPLKTSWQYMTFAGSGALVCSLLILILMLIKIIWIKATKIKCFIGFLYFLTLASQVSGFVLYFYYSKFVVNFDDTQDLSNLVQKKIKFDDPHNLSYDFGMLLSVITAILMVVNLSLACCLLPKVFKKAEIITE